MPQEPKRILVVVIAVGVLSAAGCGGQAIGPKPIEHQLDERYLVSLPAELQSAVFDAYRSAQVARVELTHARFLLSDLDAEIVRAKYDRKRAELAQDSAGAERVAAERSYLGGRMQKAARMEKSAADNQDLADGQLRYLEQQRDYLRALAKFAALEVRTREAAFELAKAELAHAQKIAPKGFELATYRAQYRNRQAKSKPARQAAMAKRRQAEDTRKKLQRPAEKSGASSFAPSIKERGGATEPAVGSAARAP